MYSMPLSHTFLLTCTLFLLYRAEQEKIQRQIRLTGTQTVWEKNQSKHTLLKLSNTEPSTLLLRKSKLNDVINLKHSRTREVVNTHYNNWIRIIDKESSSDFCTQSVLNQDDHNRTELV